MALSLEDVRLRLKEWARWSRQRGLRQGQAYSIEGNYRSPQAMLWEPLQPRPPTLNRLEAEEVEDAWRRVALHHNRFLLYHYIRKLDPRFTARRLRFTYTPMDYEAKRVLAELAIGVEIDAPQR